MDSLLQDKRVCYLTGSTNGLHRHHLYAGSRRKQSEAWGLWVWLRGDWHNLAPYGVHNNPDLDKRLKQEGQRAFEARYGHKKFMEVFGKNYLPREEK